MLTETARVVAVEDDAVWVETVRQSVCGSCSAAKGCGHGLLNKLGDGSRNYLRLASTDFPPRQFEVGDEVTIGIPESLMLRGSTVLYLLPLALMLLLAALGGLLFSAAGEVAAVIAAVAGLAAGMGLVRLHAWRHRDDGRLQPRLLGRSTGTLNFSE